MRIATIAICLVTFNLAIFGMAAPSHADTEALALGDAEKGAKVFKKCVACHMVGADAKSRIGPQLNGILNRPIASVEGFKYSKAMIKYAAENPVWTAELLEAYLEKPRQTVKGTRMSFVGLRKEKDRKNVIAYMVANSAE